MPQSNGLTMEQVLSLGGKPGYEKSNPSVPARAVGEGLTLEQVKSLGGKPGGSSLMESRRAASASEFEANQPESTMATRAREAAIGILQPFDVHNVPGIVEAVGGALYDALTGKGTAKAQELVKATAKAPVEPVREFAAGVSEGDYDKVARGAGGILSATVPALEPAIGLVKKTGQLAGAAAESVTDASRARLNPVQASAINTAEREGLPIDLATRTQSPPLKYVKMAADVTPIVSRHGARFALNLDESLTDAITRFAGTSKAEAGSFVRASLKNAVNDLQQTANKAYDAVRANAKPSTVQAGTETIADIYSGDPGATTTRPVIKTVKGATDISDVKAAAGQIIDQIEKEIPMAQRDASPGLAALKQIATLDDVTDLATADSALSQLKAIVRDAKSSRFSDVPALRSRSQGIAASIIHPMTEAIDDAAAAAGVKDLLDQGRAATRQKWAIADVLHGLNEEPVRAVEFLTAQQDRSIGALNRVLKAAPPVRARIGESVVQGILERATNEGAFKADRALADWSKLGDQTKTALFGDQADTIGDLFQFGKMAKQNVNPSGSGKALISTATGAGLVKDPISTLIGYIGLEAAARMIYSSGGARMIERAGQAMQGSQPHIGIGLLRAAGAASVAKAIQKKQ